VKEPHSDMNTINDALIPFFRALPPRTAANLAVTTAGAIDRELKDISPELVADVKANGDIRALNRSLHRKTHLDDIEVLINAQR
jgi:hypothetical protein